MKRFVKILTIIILPLAIIFISAYLYLALQGKPIAESNLTKLLGTKVKIDYLGLIPPCNLIIKDIRIEGFGKIESIFISPSIPYFAFGSIAFNKIVINNPEFEIERTPPPVSQFKKLPVLPSMDMLRKRPSKSGEKGPLNLILKRLVIKGAKVNFIDQAVGPNGVKITLKDVNFELTNFYTFRAPGVANFKLSGKIPWREGKIQGRIALNGWLNAETKDMLATLKIEDIDGIYLYPYYSKWVNLEKARIESAALNFSSNIHGFNNEVAAQCHLELTNIVRRPLKEGESEEKASKVTNAVLDIFRTMDQGKIVLDFTVKTKMNKPEFGFGDIRMAFEDKITQARNGRGFKPESVFILPAKLLEGGVRGATDLTKSVIDGTFAVGNEIKKAVEDAFKKEPSKK
ncbi:MAG: DUF748 domain-containing protein [Candidatus Omnitrophica bacterium]|nr:DUF748 domain-containing protein [Candidatus Omnitrophota bacterium]